jgi:hypothetical protein
MLFPEAIFFVVNVATHWDSRYLMFMSPLVAAITFVLMFALVRRTVRGWWPQVITGLLVSILIFSPMQWENWLWSFQLCWFMNVAGFVLAVWALTPRATDDDRPQVAWRQLVVAIAGATLATYSLGSGLMTWLVCLPLLLFQRRLRRWILLWVPVALVEVIVYFTNFTPNPDNGGLKILIDYPVLSAKYLAVYLARPFFPEFHPVASAWTSLLLILVGLLSLAYIVFRHRSSFMGVLPWVSIGAYAICGAVTTTAARMGVARILPAPDRYTTVSILLVIGVCVITAKALQLASSSADRTVLVYPARTVPALALVGVAVLLGTSFMHNIHDMQRLTDTRRVAARCMQTVTSASDTCLLELYPNQRLVFTRIEYLRSIGWIDEPPSKPGTNPTGGS